jgi:hypothetical protein
MMVVMVIGPAAAIDAQSAALDAFIQSVRAAP